MFQNKGLENLNCTRLILGNADIPISGSGTIDIKSSNPNYPITINGILPTSGGGGSIPDPIDNLLGIKVAPLAAIKADLDSTRLLMTNTTNTTTCEASFVKLDTVGTDDSNNLTSVNITLTDNLEASTLSKSSLQIADAERSSEMRISSFDIIGPTPVGGGAEPEINMNVDSDLAGEGVLKISTETELNQIKNNEMSLTSLDALDTASCSYGRTRVFISDGLSAGLNTQSTLHADKLEIIAPDPDPLATTKQITITASNGIEQLTTDSTAATTPHYNAVWTGPDLLGTYNLKRETTLNHNIFLTQGFLGGAASVNVTDPAVGASPVARPAYNNGDLLHAGSEYGFFGGSPLQYQVLNYDGIYKIDFTGQLYKKVGSAVANAYSLTWLDFLYYFGDSTAPVGLINTISTAANERSYGPKQLNGGGHFGPATRYLTSGSIYNGINMETLNLTSNTVPPSAGDLGFARFSEVLQVDDRVILDSTFYWASGV